MPPKGERRKQQIIDTAKEMFIEKGFQSTHIGQVCEKLNIARGTVYQYFSNKKEILYVLLDSVKEKIEDALDPDDLKEFLDSNPEKNLIHEFISTRMSLSLASLLNEPIIIKLIYKEIAGIDAEVVSKVDNAINSIRKLISLEIESYKNQGIFNSDLNSNIAASMLLGGIILLVYEFEKSNQDILDNTVIESIVSIYLNSTYKK